MKPEGPFIQKRIIEHKDAVKNNNKNNDIAVHAWDMGRQPNWDAAEVVETAPHYWKRRVLEATWIQTPSYTHILDCGLTFSDA